MKKLPSYDEFLNESYSNVLTKDGKKPDLVYSVDKLTYEELAKSANKYNDDVRLPNASAIGGTTQYTIYVSNGSKLETKYRDLFEKWKKEAIKNWGNSIEIFKWNDLNGTPVFLFMPGSSKKFDAHMKKIEKITPNDDALSNYYHGEGSRGRYFGD